MITRITLLLFLAFSKFVPAQVLFNDDVHEWLVENREDVKKNKIRSVSWTDEKGWFDEPCKGIKITDSTIFNEDGWPIFNYTSNHYSWIADSLAYKNVKGKELDSLFITIYRRGPSDKGYTDTIHSTMLLKNGLIQKYIRGGTDSPRELLYSYNSKGQLIKVADKEKSFVRRYEYGTSNLGDTFYNEAYILVNGKFSLERSYRMNQSVENGKHFIHHWHMVDKEETSKDELIFSEKTGMLVEVIEGVGRNNERPQIIRYSFWK